MYYPEVFENPQHLLAGIEILLTDPTEELVVPFGHFLGLLTSAQLKQFLHAHYTEPPSIAEPVFEMLSYKKPRGFGGELDGALHFLTSLTKSTVQQFAHTRKVGTAGNLMDAFTVRRPSVTLDMREQETFRGMAHLLLFGTLDLQAWKEFVARVAWGEGTHAYLEPDASVAQHRDIHDAYRLAQLLLQKTLTPYAAVLAEAARQVATARPAMPAPVAAAIPEPYARPRLMTRGDLDDAASLSLDWAPSSLTLGFTDDAEQRPVFFNGHESLITVGASGSYKTTAHVIRNLLTFPGSAIVLDVKGELWEKTAGHRAAHFGPVYRFSPAAKDQRSHCFNPFDFISRDPLEATADCEAFSYEVIADNPDTRDPYWENRARNFLWAFAVMIAIGAPQSLRNLSHLARNLGLNTSGEQTSKHAPVKLAPPTEAALAQLAAFGDKYGIRDLNNVAEAIRTGIGLHSNRVESILDIARNHVTPFNQRILAQRVTSRSDWHPLDLRTTPGTTIYLHVPTAELKSFAPLLRLMIYQHMRLLLDYTAAPGEPPITFFLDELPQLGNFKSILQMQAVGRSAGLRLWMFVQNVRQLHTAYGLEAGKAIPEDTRVRCYMKPDESIAAHIARTLGESENMFTGETRRIASAADIRGPKYRNKTFVFASEDYPIILERRPAFADLGHLMQPPPVVPLAPESPIAPLLPPLEPVEPPAVPEPPAPLTDV